jgi:hypothetical protein
MEDREKQIKRHSFVRGEEWTYEEIRPYLMTGDQVIFKGKGLLSGLICFLTGGDKSHIGTVVRNQYEVQLLESDWGKVIHGLQLSPLGEKIGKYNGDVCIRFMNCPRSAEWYKTLYDYIEKNRGTSYGFAEKQLFCSKTSAEIFRLWGYLPKYVAEKYYTPEDFDEDKKVDAHLREASLLMPGTIWLGPCQKIVPPVVAAKAGEVAKVPEN